MSPVGTSLMKKIHHATNLTHASLLHHETSKWLLSLSTSSSYFHSDRLTLVRYSGVPRSGGGWKNSKALLCGGLENDQKCYGKGNGFCHKYTLFIRKWCIRKQYAAAQKVKKVQYWIFET